MLKRVCKFKKGEIWDGDSPYCYIIDDNLTTTPKPGLYPIFKDDYKVTVLIEKIRKKGD